MASASSQEARNDLLGKPFRKIGWGIYWGSVVRSGIECMALPEQRKLKRELDKIKFRKKQRNPKKEVNKKQGAVGFVIYFCAHISSGVQESQQV